MLPIAWWACRSCSTRARNSALSPQASSRNAGHWSGARSRAARKIDRAWSSIAVMGILTGASPLSNSATRPGEFSHDGGKIPGPLRVLQQLAVQPGAGVGPVPIGRCRRDAQGRGGLVERQAGEIAELDEFPRQGVEGRQPRRARRPGRPARRGRRRSPRRVPRNRRAASRRRACRAPCRGRVSTRIRRMASAAAAKKWPRLFQCWAHVHVHQAQVGLVDQGGGLRASGPAFVRQLLRPPACAARRRPAAGAAPRRAGRPARWRTGCG